MPHFKVTLSGEGIDLPIGSSSCVGFFTTRHVRATDLASAEDLAREMVLSEWRMGGAYAQNNRGALPRLSIEQSRSVGWIAGTFGRKPTGYTFYRQDD